MPYASPQEIERMFDRLSHQHPDTAAVELRLAAALTLGVSEDWIVQSLGPLWASMREIHDREVLWRRQTNRVGMPR